jgi:hypothetical protein
MVSLLVELRQEVAAGVQPAAFHLVVERGGRIRLQSGEFEPASDPASVSVRLGDFHRIKGLASPSDGALNFRCRATRRPSVVSVGRLQGSGSGL